MSSRTDQAGLKDHELSNNAKTAENEGIDLETVVNENQKWGSIKVTHSEADQWELATPKVDRACKSVTERSNPKCVYNSSSVQLDDDQVLKCDESYLSDGLKVKLIKKTKSLKPSCDRLEVILDSGATSHMFPSTVVFQTYVNISNQERYVSLGDDKVKLSIIGSGKVEFLGESLYVPKLKFGLISISYFDKQGFKTVIEDSSIKVYDTDERLHLEGYLNNNLYYLKNEYLETILSKSRTNDKVQLNFTKEVNEIDKRLYNIHHKLGHVSIGKIKLAVKNGLVDGLNLTDKEIKKGKLDFCYDCMRGKMKADPSGNSTNHQKEWKMFEKVAVDYKGPYAVHSYHHYNGFYLFSDYYTDYVWVYLVKSKSEFINALRAFYISHNVTYKVELKVLQGDFDTMHKDELVKQFLKENKVTRLQLSAPYNHSQNGQVERDMQSVLNVSRTLMSAGGAPNWFWEFAIIHACKLINYTPTSNKETDFKTPFELVTGKKPNVEKLVPFYAPGVYHVTKEEQRGNNSLSKYKAAPCRYLGINPDSPANYLIYDILQKRIITRSSCKFEENFTKKSIAYYEDQLKIADIDEEFLDVHRDEWNDVEEDIEETLPQKNPDNDISEPQYVPSTTENVNFDEEMEEYEENGGVLNYWQSPFDNNNDNIIIPMYNQWQKTSEESEGSTDRETNSEKSYVSINVPYDVNLQVSNDFHQEWVQQVAHDVKEISLPPAPKTINEALDENNPDFEHWYQAVLNELGILQDQGTFGEAEQFGRAMKTKFVFTTSFKPDFTIKYKARLVVCGYSQIYGIDYEETFAPTTPITNILILLHIAKVKRAIIASFDVTGAFLEGTNDFEQYCWLPEEISDKKLRVRIIKSLYGQKQSPKIWNDHLNNILLQMGLERCPVSPCLYRYYLDNRYLYTTIHVDDGLMMADSSDTVHQFMEVFKSYVKDAKLFSPVQKFLGMQIEEDEEYVYLHQSEYIKNIDLLGIKDVYKSEKVPMKSSINLRICEQNNTLPQLLPVSGVLRYVSDRTRPDLLISVGEMSSNGSPHPSDKHVEVAKNILRFVKSTCDDKLTLGGSGPVVLKAYSDASYITTGKCKSRLGGCLFLGDDSGSIQSFSRNDATVSHSSCEAEIKAIDLVIKSVLHVRDVLEFLGEKQIEKTVIYTDSKSSIDLLNTLKSNGNTNHINVRIHFIRESLNNSQIKLKFIGTNDNLADGLTKPLEGVKFQEFKSKLLNLR